MKLTYKAILKRSPYGLIVNVPELDLRIIFNNKELNECLIQHSTKSIKDFLTLYSDTYFVTLINKIEEEIYWCLKYLLDVEGYIPYSYSTFKLSNTDKEDFCLNVTTNISIKENPRADLKIIKNVLNNFRIKHNPKLKHDPYNGYLKNTKLKRTRKSNRSKY